MKTHLFVWRTRLLLGLFFISLIPMVALAQTNIPDAEPGERAPGDEKFDEPLLQGIEYVFSDRYEEALALFDSLTTLYPSHPAPYFYKAATYQSWMSSYRFNKFQPELEENVQKAIDLGNKMMESDDDPWLNFYVGAAYGYRAFHRFRQHNWLGAYFDGNRGIDNFKKALEKMPELYDCYLGVGSYHYWRTAKSDFIRVVAFWMKDRRELGLEQIEFSIHHGRYCPQEATYGLIIAYYDYGEFEKALALNEEALKLSDPPSMAALYMRGRLLAHFDRWEEAEDIFLEILRRLQEAKYASLGYQAECQYWIAQAQAEQGELEPAFKLVEQALVLSNDRNKEDELENPIDNFDDLKKEMEKLHKSLQERLSQN